MALVFVVLPILARVVEVLAVQPMIVPAKVVVAKVYAALPIHAQAVAVHAVQPMIVLEIEAYVFTSKTPNRCNKD